jgi:hypothetical protein
MTDEKWFSISLALLFKVATLPAKTRLQHILTAAAINLVRLAAWFAGDIPSTTRTPPLVAVLNMVPLN